MTLNKEEFKIEIKNELREFFLARLDEYNVINSIPYVEYMKIIIETVADLEKISNQGKIEEEIGKIFGGNYDI